MPILPFAQHEYKVLEKNSGLFIVQTNSGLSPFWLVLTFFLLFQSKIVMAINFVLILLACGYRTRWKILKTSGEIIRERKVYEIPVHRKIIQIKDIEVVILEQIPGSSVNREYALSFSLNNGDGILIMRVGLARFLKALLSEIRHYLPDNMKYEIESNIGEKDKLISLFD